MRNAAKWTVMAFALSPLLAWAATSAQAEDKPLQITFITHDLGAGIFAPVRLGMEDACAKVQAQCEFLGPATYDPAAQVALIEATIAKKPDAIVTTRPDPSAYNDAIKKALDAGIMVVTFNTNDPAADKKIPLPFVGQNFTNYGKEWAHEAMKAMPNGGTMAITDCCFGHFALEERIRSFKETLDKEGGGKYKVLDVINTSADESKVFAVIEAYYQAHPDINAIWGVDYYSHVIAQFIKKNNLQGKLLTGGSDMGPGNIEGIKNKYVAFGLGQNPFMQGFYPVMMVYQAKKYGIRPVTIDTGTDVVTPANFDQYNPKYR
jgi:simple sugar transport system substrate-binding protein